MTHLIQFTILITKLKFYNKKEFCDIYTNDEMTDESGILFSTKIKQTGNMKIALVYFPGGQTHD